MPIAASSVLTELPQNVDSTTSVVTPPQTPQKKHHQGSAKSVSPSIPSATDEENTPDNSPRHDNCSPTSLTSSVQSTPKHKNKPTSFTPSPLPDPVKLVLEEQQEQDTNRSPAPPLVSQPQQEEKQQEEDPGLYLYAWLLERLKESRSEYNDFSKDDDPETIRNSRYYAKIRLTNADLINIIKNYIIAQLKLETYEDLNAIAVKFTALANKITKSNNSVHPMLVGRLLADAADHVAREKRIRQASENESKKPINITKELKANVTTFKPKTTSLKHFINKRPELELPKPPSFWQKAWAGLVKLFKKAKSTQPQPASQPSSSKPSIKNNNIDPNIIKDYHNLGPVIAKLENISKHLRAIKAVYLRIRNAANIADLKNSRRRVGLTILEEITNKINDQLGQGYSSTDYKIKCEALHAEAIGALWFLRRAYEATDHSYALARFLDHSVLVRLINKKLALCQELDPYYQDHSSVAIPTKKYAQEHGPIQGFLDKHPEILNNPEHELYRGALHCQRKCKQHAPQVHSSFTTPKKGVKGITDVTDWLSNNFEMRKSNRNTNFFSTVCKKINITRTHTAPARQQAINLLKLLKDKINNLGAQASEEHLRIFRGALLICYHSISSSRSKFKKDLATVMDDSTKDEKLIKLGNAWALHDTAEHGKRPGMYDHACFEIKKWWQPEQCIGAAKQFIENQKVLVESSTTATWFKEATSTALANVQKGLHEHEYRDVDELYEMQQAQQKAKQLTKTNDENTEQSSVISLAI